MKSKLFGFTVCTLLSVATGVAFSSEPVVIASGQAELTPKQPQAAVARSGNVHLVYGVTGKIFHCCSTDEGVSFEKPREAFQVSNLSLGMRRGPRVAITDTALVVTVIGGKQGKGRDGDLQAWRSTDEGLTWKGPVNVNEAADSAREGLHGMAAGTDGSVWCVWLDLREKRTEIFASKSADGGATWQSNLRVYRSPDGSVCECCHPSVAVSGETIRVMFRNSLRGNRDMYLVTSEDGGKTFSPGEKLGEGTWKLNACPMDGGMLAIGERGKCDTVWRRNGEIFVTGKPGGKELRLGKGEQPWIANSKAGSLIAWTAGREGDLLTYSTGPKQSKKIAEAARDPMVAASTNGDGPVIICWESKLGDAPSVMAMRIDAD